MRRQRRTYDHSVSRVSTGLRFGARGMTWNDAPVLLLLAAAMALLTWFFVDPRFYVYEATVEGNTWIRADEVYRASGLDTLSAFYVDRDQVAERICQNVPGVTHADVGCSWPNRVQIRIEERNARFVWRTGSMAYMVDGAGWVLEADDGSHDELLSIRDVDKLSLQAGGRVSQVALETADGLHTLLPNARAFEYSAASGITLVDVRGWRMCFGDNQRLAEKVVNMQVLLQQIVGSGASAEYVDLRFVDSPYYR